MSIINDVKKKILSRNSKANIIFAEGWNKSIQQASEILFNEQIINPILIFKNQEELNDYENKLNIETKVITNKDIEHYTSVLYELRKEKGLGFEEAKKLASQPNYFSMLMLKEMVNAGVVCGIEYSTRDTLKSALQIIKSEKFGGLVSSSMIMEKEDKLFILADIGLVINPNYEELSKITYNTIDFAKNKLSIDNLNVALLSYSTNGSSVGESVDKVKNSYKHFLENFNNFDNVSIYGEMQFDAALNKQIRNKKCPDCNFNKDANVFIFPNLDAGNISYKILQRVAGFEPIGPIILGLKKPVNDLSRGANLQEIISLSYITALQIEK